MINIEGHGAMHCDMSVNMIKCGSDMGVWNYDDLIIFTNGAVLTKVKN